MKHTGAFLATLLATGYATLTSAPASADILIDGSSVHPESISADIDGNIYVGSFNGTIYRAEADSDTAHPWILPTEANGLTSTFGILADENRGLLWVCNNPPFGTTPAPGQKSGLKSFDLVTGEMTGSYDFPGDGPATCNDMTIEGIADIYVTDTGGGRIFHLAPGADELELFAQGPELIGVDGIAVSGNGTIYINNVRQNTVQRVNVGANGSFAGLTTLELSEPVAGPDGLRLVGGNRFVQAENQSGRITYLDIDGDTATITPIKTGLESSPGVTHVNGMGYATEGKIGYIMDPELRGQDPGQFYIRSFPLPDWP